LIIGAEDLEGATSDYLIHVSIGDRERECPGPECIVNLEETSAEGVGVEFGAQAIDDGRKNVYWARVRVLSAGESPKTRTGPWHVQVLSKQWAGEPVDACAVAWETFTPVAEPPSWLRTPSDAGEIATEVTYYYLTAELISAGAVDVDGCPNGGLAESGSPNACGLERATPLVSRWQDQFDPGILDAARVARIPAALVKAVIAKESQFWPASVVERREYGLGHLTEPGADNTLLWNTPFYQRICTSALGETHCGTGYSHQSEYRRAILRGSLLSSVDADCPDCEWGVDLGVATEGVRVLTETLVAYCLQTGRMVFNVTGETPGTASTYEDMWKLSLASYAGGPGCVAEALKAATVKGRQLSWPSVSQKFGAPCEAAANYVDDVAR
jgi:hypothetical protein